MNNSAFRNVIWNRYFLRWTSSTDLVLIMIKLDLPLQVSKNVAYYVFKK